MTGADSRPSPDEPAEFEIPTSMIDVVFLLLIFFMCATRFRALEQRIEVPTVDGVPDIGPPPPPELDRVMVRIRMNGERPVILANEYPCDDLNDLARKLCQLSRNLPELGVLIDSRQDVPFLYVLGAVDACARARLTDVSFMAPPAPGGGGSDFWYR